MSTYTCQVQPFSFFWQDNSTHLIVRNKRKGWQSHLTIMIRTQPSQLKQKRCVPRKDAQNHDGGISQQGARRTKPDLRTGAGVLALHAWARGPCHTAESHALPHPLTSSAASLQTQETTRGPSSCESLFTEERELACPNLQICLRWVKEDAG